MSIMDRIFGSSQPTQTAPSPTGDIKNAGIANPGQPLPGTTQTQTTEINGAVPANIPESPLSKFKDMWNTPENQKIEDPRIFGEVDPKKVFDSAKNVDFSKAITPELSEKLKAGGDEAVSATLQIMNSFAQQAYGQSATATISLVETALAKQSERFDKMLEQKFGNMSAKQDIIKSNPILNNPAVVPLRDAAVAMFQRRSPNATPDEIKQQVISYFDALKTELGTSGQPTQQSTQSKQQSAQIDWGDWVNQ